MCFMCVICFQTYLICHIYANEHDHAKLLDKIISINDSKNTWSLDIIISSTFAIITTDIYCVYIIYMDYGLSCIFIVFPIYWMHQVVNCHLCWEPEIGQPWDLLFSLGIAGSLWSLGPRHCCLFQKQTNEQTHSWLVNVCEC